MLTLTIEQTGANELRVAFNTLGQKIEDLTPLWYRVRDEFYAIEKEQFESEGDAGASGAWEPLEPRYAAWKALHYGDRPILQRTGALRVSLTTDAADVLITPDSLTIGSPIDYAIYHQLGTSRMPARPPIDLSDADVERLTGIADEWLGVLVGQVVGEAA